MGHSPFSRATDLNVSTILKLCQGPKLWKDRNQTVCDPFVDGSVFSLFAVACASKRDVELSYQLGAELLNFGAFIGFMGVNLAAFVRYYVRNERRTFLDLAPPLLGFAICAYIWWSLRTPAKLAGLAWLAAGLLYGAWKTGGFRRPIAFAAPDETASAPLIPPASPVIARELGETGEDVVSS